MKYLLIGIVAVASLVLVLGCAGTAATPTQAPAKPTQAASPTQPALPAASAAATKAVEPTKAATAAAKVSFPEKGRTVTIIVPTDAGGPSDVGSRIMAAQMEKVLGVPVQVTNKPGATGLVGLTEMVRSRPDGYTLSAFAVIAHVAAYVDQSRKPPFGRQDLQPVGAYGEDDMLLTVKADGPYKGLQDLISAAKANPGKVKVAGSGVMGGPHICWLLLQELTGIKLSVVQFDGGAAMQTALAGGHVDASLAGAAGAVSLLKAGTIRGIGITAREENPFVPGVKTFDAQGVKLYYSAVHGFAAPAGVPADAIDVLTSAMKKAAEDPSVRQKLEGIGQADRYLDPKQFGTRWTEGEDFVKKGMELVEKEKKQ